MPLAAVLYAGCREGEEPAELVEAPVLAFDTTQVCIATALDTIPVTVEVAADDAQRSHGLMERQQLRQDAGMLFTYAEPQAPESGYWMFRTRIPLDIAFLGPSGEIRAIRSMDPCTSPYPRWCDSYPAGVEFHSALEVNRGFFASRGIERGDRVIRRDQPGCPPG